jgi:hypothetical protein
MGISNLASAEYLFVEGKFNPNKKWSDFSNQKKLNFKNLFQMLIKSKTGHDLVRRANSKAKEYGKTLYDVVDEGSGSLTDTTLIRKFTTGHPDHITYETKSKVFLNKELNQYDALLDLAHELTHFVYRKNFNPYVKNFSLSEFISNTIEGVGGEVQAFMMECKIHNELFPKKRSTRYNCQKISHPDTGTLSFNLAVKQFYQVGDYFESFSAVLSERGIKEHFPDVSSSKVSFVSSAYGIPYPVAAFEEYLSVLNKVCANDKKRISYFKNEAGRGPASLKSLESSYLTRCKSEFN